MLLRLCVVALSLGLVSGRPDFLEMIPNGYRVPNPCNPQETWRGVGHMALGGGGELNQFGKDFRDSGFNWQNVCPLDSDGDGLTNGQELGDPQCVWTRGTPTGNGTQTITHPAFCDPLQDARCISNPNKPRCEDQTFNCPAINEPEVISRELKFPRTNIPNTETNYYCMTFDLDTSQDYHMIATRPNIDNDAVMHHAVLYGCNGAAEDFYSPTSCGMSSQNCTESISIWSVGITGDCMYKDAGFRIGKTGYKQLILEFHWNNPDLRTDHYDASGLTIYYTPKLRKHDAGIFWTGEMYLNIPPKNPWVVFDSECPSDCTRNMLTDTIYFTHGLNHMHYRGELQTVRLESGKNVTILTNEEEYNYDTPKKYVYDPPIPVRPGDRLLTTCIFSSMKDTETTTWGLGTDDEMCFGFFTYYPKANTKDNECLSSGSFDNCRLTEDGYYGACHIRTFFDRTNPETRMFMEKVISGCTAGLCDKACHLAIQEAHEHPCMTHKNKEWALRFTSQGPDELAQQFVRAMKTCDSKMPTSAAVVSTAAVSTSILAAVALYVNL